MKYAFCIIKFTLSIRFAQTENYCLLFISFTANLLSSPYFRPLQLRHLVQYTLFSSGGLSKTCYFWLFLAAAYPNRVYILILVALVKKNVHLLKS